MSPSDAHDRDGPCALSLRPYLDPETRTGGVLLAVSGGPDSSALMHAAARFGSDVPLAVATVDHGLRPESEAEARGVAAAAAKFGLPHHHLAWTGPKSASGIQAAARSARYRLLAECAAAIGAAFVLTGHTRDDQAETVLMRLFAGSGPAGLAGMRAERPLAAGVRLARPFLKLPKAALVAYCEAQGLAYLRDPSNADERFARARLRELLPLLEAEGLSAERLCRLAERSARDEAALAAAADAAFAASRRPAETSLVLDGAALCAMPEAIALRVLDAAIAEAGGGGAERLERLERLVLDELLPALHQGRPLRRTLRETLVEATRTGDVALRRAPPRAMSKA